MCKLHSLEARADGTTESLIDFNTGLTSAVGYY